ncbi:hypothetical protein LAZ67_9003309, partial [Cordylochernes scorpioides]
MVIGLKRAGWSIRQIAADTHLGASTVHRLWRRWLEQGNVAIYRNVGATRVTSARVDRRILRQAVAAPQTTCTAILQHVQDTLDHSISTRTISRRLVANGLHSCRPLRRLPLTPPNRRQRLEWCRARSTWMTEWHRVVFSDESRFCLSSDSRRVRVCRRRGERSNPAAIVERPTVRQRGIMVWGAIAYDSRSPLLRIQGTMTAQRYVDDVLRPVTLPYLQGVPNALYQQDNARPHTARISQQALQDVQMLPWPPYSPDLSPIEHVWDIIGRRSHALPQPRSEDELWQMVEREWSAIPQEAIRTLIDSLPRRVAACIAVRDESRFCLSSDSRRVRVWRRRGERSNPAAIVERPTVRQRGIMVWGAIAYDSRSPLLRIQGTMTAQRYVDDVLRPVTLQGVPNALYQQDNARPHIARISQQALQDVQMLPWPPYSPDLSPIEHVWDIIGRRLHALPQPRSEDELWQMVEREWRAIPQDAIRTLIDSLPRRAVEMLFQKFLFFLLLGLHYTIPIMIKNESGETSSQVPSTYFSLQQPRCPSSFAGDGSQDAQQWLKEYKRVAKFNRWDCTLRLANTVFFLDRTALKWFENNEETVTSWDDFQRALGKAFGQQEEVIKEAESLLKNRAQKSKESLETYIQDVLYLISIALYLCQVVNPQMDNNTKLGHLMKRVAKDIYQILIAKDVENRTPDDRPLCFHCGRPGHIVRYCRERRQVFADARARREPRRSTTLGGDMPNIDEIEPRIPPDRQPRSASPYPGRGISTGRRPSRSPSR